MQTETVCIFPDTRPRNAVLFPLVQLFAEVVYIASIENDMPLLPPLAQEMLVQGLLRFRCPAPLGAERERFLHMISELRQRPGEYATLSLQREEPPESKHSIISALRRSGGEHDDRKKKEQLWHARLVLKLGEIMEEQEEDIREKLHRIALKEDELLRNLRERNDAPLAAHEQQNAEQFSASRTRLRLKAWRNLVSLGSEPPTADVFVTEDHEAFDLLMEERGLAPEPDCVLLLPAFITEGACIDKRKGFRAAAADMIKELSEHPTEFSAKEWGKLLEEHYPAEAHGRCQLSLHQEQGADRQRTFGIIEQQP